MLTDKYISGYKLKNKKNRFLSIGKYIVEEKNNHKIFISNKSGTKSFFVGTLIKKILILNNGFKYSKFYNSFGIDRAIVIFCLEFKIRGIRFISTHDNKGYSICPKILYELGIVRDKTRHNTRGEILLHLDFFDNI